MSPQASGYLGFNRYKFPLIFHLYGTPGRRLPPPVKRQVRRLDDVLFESCQIDYENVMTGSGVVLDQQAFSTRREGQRAERGAAIDLNSGPSHRD